MVSLISPPDPRTLLPPLLACLPTSFVSPQPPPALLPLLSPILRQRVQLLSASASHSDSWLQLLCWDPQRAAKLSGIVENLQLEPHPVSGEVEIDDVEDIKYRRLDEETLQARLDAETSNLCFIFLWCTGDEKAGDGWRLSELRALEDGEDGTEWYESVSEANENSRTQRGARSASTSQGVNGPSGTSNTATATSNAAGANDDDDYWASYDRTPARTPAKRSPAPVSSSVQVPSNSELEYFARYMAEVQPAMDPHDPSEEGLPAGESTLNGHEITGPQPQKVEDESQEITDTGPAEHDLSIPPAHSTGTRNDSSMGIVEDTKTVEIEHPRPSSSSSHGSVDKLEQTAKMQSQAEIAIKQHISTDLKSLFRLARSSGIDRKEFERIVQTELECLSMMDLDE